MPRHRDIFWKLDNFVAGIHTKPGQVRGGELHAADVENLIVDKNGWLRLRPDFEDIGGQGGTSLTGIASTPDRIFLLYRGGRLGMRRIEDLEIEYEVTGTEGDLDGRLSVVSAFRDYVILTSEGSDRGYWIDVREGADDTEALPLGLDKPHDGFFTLSKYPMQDDLDTYSLPLRDGVPGIFVAYKVSYVRQAQVLSGDEALDVLFNGMESPLSEPQYAIFHRFHEDFAAFYEQARLIFDGSLVFPSTLSRRYVGEPFLGNLLVTVEGTQNLREYLGVFNIGYVGGEGSFLGNFTGLGNGEKIVCRPSYNHESSADDIVITLTSDNAIRDEGGYLQIAQGNYNREGEFSVGTVYKLYPADGEGEIKGESTSFDNLPPGVTGINVYRSTAVIQYRHGSEFQEIQEQINDDEVPDVSTLEFHKIAYLSKESLDNDFFSGIYVAGEDDGEPSELDDFGTEGHNIEFYYNYYTRDELSVDPDISSDDNEFAFKTVFPEPLQDRGSGFSFFIFPILNFGGGDEPSPSFGFSRYALPDRPDVVNFYNWDDGPLDYGFPRLPSEVTQITEYNNRIFGSAGDRLVYSEVDNAELLLWAFPEFNEIRRARSGRVDFCASHRGSLLFGGRDGLFRLIGSDRFNFDVDDIGAFGPVDGYSWGTVVETIVYVGEGGFFVTDSTTIEFISDLVLDGYFQGHEVERGSVTSLPGGAILYSVELRELSENRESFSHIFVFDDGHWMRWTEPDLLSESRTVYQVAELSAGQNRYFFADGLNNLRELKWAERVGSDSELGWSWSSNWIKGTSGNLSNVKKRFREVLLSAAYDGEMRLEYLVDNDEDVREIDGISVRDDLYFHRVPVERRGERFRFRLSGNGPLTLRGIQIQGRL